MHMSLYLVLLHLGWCVQCDILYPNYSYKQKPRSIREIYLQTQGDDPIQSNDRSMDEQEEDFVRGLSDNRMERHVDAMFTNTYRKFLGQISARRYLQNMMGKRLGQDIKEWKGLQLGDSDRTIRDALETLLRESEGPERREEQPPHVWL
ncbi:somatoliberin [Pelobates cultripes]|uniref:Somatoliberin n=2 Tax=Pelobates cultripes TaxID=61616 RepID=A0AAD1W819_PELCU|nr:somatoliberin [Pelobates cultripes]